MRKLMMLFVLLGAVLLAGCSFNTKIEDEVSTILGDMYEAETIYRDNQQDLQALEQAEQQLFAETIELTQEDTELLAAQVKELQETVEERVVKITEEAEAMKEAEAFVAELEAIEKKASADEQAELVKLKEAIIHRYETHHLFTDHYQALTAEQKKLYGILLEEKIEIAKLDEQVDLVNEQNEQVIVAVEDFNEATEQLNEIRAEVEKTFKKSE